MRRLVLGLFALIGIVTMLAFVGIGVTVWRIALSQPVLPATIVLNAASPGDAAPLRNEPRGAVFQFTLPGA